MKLHERFSCSLLSRSYPSQTEISKHIGISSASISWQIKRLQDYRIVDEIKEGKFKRYKLHGDSKQVVALLKNYYPGIWSRWSNRLAEMFLSLSQGEETIVTDLLSMPIWFFLLSWVIRQVENWDW